jgi:hypothetical protein
MNATAVRFARYRPTERDIRGRHAWAAPEGGLCLSAFLVVTDGDAQDVLLGRPDPGWPWERCAALGPAHLAGVGERWILPSSHLLEFESPDEAAVRVARDLLEVPRLDLDGPRVFSERYPSTLDEEPKEHWDLHFVYRAAWPSGRPLRAAAWRNLRLHSRAQLRRSDVARDHSDILELAGLPLGGTQT